MIARVLPSGVAGADTLELSRDSRLFPQEADALVGARVKRREEFTAGRACARTALSLLGCERVAIPVGHDSAPTWPPGIVGSITHCDGYCAAAVAPVTKYRTIGIDAERNRPVAEATLYRFASSGEVAQLKRLESCGAGVYWGRLLLSAKESVLKALYPLTGRVVRLTDTSIKLDPSVGTFEARISGTVDVVAGRWLAGDLLLTGVAIPCDRTSQRHRE